MSIYHLQHLTDADLMAGLTRLTREEFERTAELLAHLAEVDHRRAYLAHASASLFDYCVGVLNLAEGAAYKRIFAARLARRFPMIFELVAAGEVHLSALGVLGPHLTEDNHRALLEAARRKTKQAVKELLAKHFPRPDVPETLRRLPQPAATRADAVPTPAPLLAPSSTDVVRASPPLAERSAARPPVEPLSEDRHRLTLTISGRVRDRLLAAKALLGHQRPGCDLAAVLELAVDELVERLERRRFGKRRKGTGASVGVASSSAAAGSTAVVPVLVTGAPAQLSPETVAAAPANGAPAELSRETIANAPAQRSPETVPPRSRHIPAAIRRAVAERDQYACTFRDPAGRRCASRQRLEYHHLDPFARGGGHSLDNLTLRCRGHNAHQAVLDFGADRMSRYARGGIGREQLR